MSYHERDWYDRDERKRAAARLSASLPVAPPPNPYKDALTAASLRCGSMRSLPSPPRRSFHLPSWILGALFGGFLVYFLQRVDSRLFSWLAAMF